MTDSLHDVTILVPSKLYEHAVGRLGRSFDMVRIERADAALVGGDLAGKVRGVAGMTAINAAFIDALPKLEIIANMGVGYDSVDARHAASRGVMVTNTPDVLTEEVADTTLGLLINAVRELPRAEQWLRQGRWEKEGPYPLTGATLRGRRVGIFGMGRIGIAIARRVEAFGLSVAYHNRRKVEGVPYAHHPTLLGLAQAVDTLISVAPGGAATEKAVNAEVLAALGPNGVFVNIGRGSTVDEEALIAGARQRHHPRCRPRRVRARAACAASADRPSQRLAAAACRLGLGAYAQRHGRPRRRQSHLVPQGVADGGAGR